MKNFRTITTLFLVISLIFGGSACSKAEVDKGKPEFPSSSTQNSSVPSSSVLSSSETDSSSYSSQVTITEYARPYYKPMSVTVSFYDTSKSSYGFTWNTEFSPAAPVLQYCEGESFNAENCKEVSAETKMAYVYNPSITQAFISKAEVALKPNTTYTYRAYDKDAEIGSEVATLKTEDTNSSKFRFVHVSDSQVSGGDSDVAFTGEGTGKYFGDTLNAIFQNKPSFLLHTGDIVEYSKYETYWKNMLDYNGKYLREIPLMPISGNHETTYRAGTNEIFKHFNLKITEQDTDKGFYYDFDFGNVKFIMLNTNRLEDNGLEAKQYNWLIKTLKANTKKWTVVAMHLPMYSVGKYGADPEKNAASLKVRGQLVKLFAEYKVDLVLQGHDHAYSKTYPIKADGTADLTYESETVDSIKYAINPKGAIYAMHGPAGNQSRSPVAIDNNLFEFASASTTNSWAEISVEDNRLTVSIKNCSTGKINGVYSYGIIKK